MSVSKVKIIISRFNENLNWLQESPFNEFQYIVYNKGDNDNFNKTNVVSIVNLPNVGKCDHTYLYHIVNNFDNLDAIKQSLTQFDYLASIRMQIQYDSIEALNIFLCIFSFSCERQWFCKRTKFKLMNVFFNYKTAKFRCDQFSEVSLKVQLKALTKLANLMVYCPTIL